MKDIFFYLSEFDIANSTTLSLFQHRCLDRFGWTPSQYITGLGRANSDYGLWQETHLYIPFGHSYRPLCDRGWNRDGGTSFSILRGNQSELGVCPVCIARAGVELPPVKAFPEYGDKPLKPGLEVIPEWARAIVNTQEWFLYDHSRSLSVGEYAEFWLEQEIKLHCPEIDQETTLSPGNYSAWIASVGDNEKIDLLIDRLFLYCQVPVNLLRVDCNTVQPVDRRWRLENMAAEFTLRHAIANSQQDYVSIKRYYPVETEPHLLPTLDSVVDALESELYCDRKSPVKL